jgi:hypothetical protein
VGKIVKKTDHKPISWEDWYPTIKQMINDSEKEILYISPCTCFGNYSLGLKNFEEVCEKLEQAKQRGADINLIVEVLDSTTAECGKGLLGFLTDNKEIKHHDNIPFDYVLIVDGNKALVGRTKVEFKAKYSGITVRPYQDPIAGHLVEEADEIRSERNRFRDKWQKASSIKKAIKTKRTPSARVNSRFYCTKGFLILTTLLFLVALPLFGHFWSIMDPQLRNTVLWAIFISAVLGIIIEVLF